MYISPKKGKINNWVLQFLKNETVLQFCFSFAEYILLTLDECFYC